MDLLEYLTKLLECTYLSDLHFASIQPQQLTALLSIPDEQFPLEQYRMALDYLAETSVVVSDLPTARQLLVDALQKHPS